MYTIDYTPYKFLDWIEKHERWLDRSELERCPKFLYLLEKEKEIFIRWIDISRNPNAIHLGQSSLIFSYTYKEIDFATQYSDAYRSRLSQDVCRVRSAGLHSRG